MLPISQIMRKNQITFLLILKKV